MPMGSQEWEVQRVSAGVPASGTELTGDSTPFEAGAPVLLLCTSLCKPG